MFRDQQIPDPGPYRERPDVSVTDPMIARPDAFFDTLGVGPYAYPGCNFLDCLGETPEAPFADSQPGCVILGCVILGCVILGCVGTDPRTPGIR